ncbi:MAG: hypothetical protein NC131_09945 [Roseburia sp.]|nr:hypothetical protein [Roseburia sp.]
MAAELTLDALIEGNGNWMIVHVYNNWGNPIMMLLPHFDLELDSKEAIINNSCISVGEGVFEEEYAIHQWLEKHADTPFIVSEKTFLECAHKMSDIVAAYNNNREKFLDDATLFDQWREVVCYVDLSTNGEEQALVHCGWESLIEKAHKAMEELG